MAFAASGYPCLNPSAQCTNAPDLSALNTALGCLQLDSGCIPTQCPSFRCGNTCPPPCPDDVDDCTAWWAKQGGGETQDCTTFYHSYVLRTLKRVPMEGCTAACTDGPHAGSNTCCSAATFDGTKDRPWDFSSTVSSKYLSNGAVVGPPLAYQNFLNYLKSCERGTCFCPTQPPTKATNQLQQCSGHGTCVFAGAASDPRDVSNNYFCQCDGGYTGPDCGTQQGSTVGCPKGWDDGENTLAPCSGVAKGTCSTATGTCTCTPGWAGDNCSIQTCPVDEDGNICSGNGQCTWLDTCQCYTGFSGPACNCSVGANRRKVCKPLQPSGSGGAPQPASGSDSDVTSVASSSVVEEKQREANLVHAGVAVGVAVFVGFAAWHILGRRSVKSHYR